MGTKLERIAEISATTKRPEFTSLYVKLVGYYRYYGVSFNVYKLSAFLHRVQQFLFKAMNRRGCRRTYTWNGFIDMLKYYPLAKPKVYYPLY